MNIFVKNFSRHLVLLSAVSFSSIAWADKVVIGALVSGQVSAVSVKAGQTVKAGAPLLTLDASRFEAKLKRLQAQADLQDAKLKDAQIEFDTAQDLYDRTVTSRRSFDASKLAFSIAKAEAQQAQAALDEHQAWRKYVYITAPVSGKVVKLFAPVGTTVFKENQPLVEIQTP